MNLFQNLIDEGMPKQVTIDISPEVP